MVTLDKKDKKILQALDKNARLSIANISRKTGIQRDSILYRINKMKKYIMKLQGKKSRV